MAERPLGVPSLGAFADDLITSQLTQKPAPADVLDAGVRARFVPPLRATLDRLGAEGRITRDEVATILQEPADSVATELWLRALHASDLATATDGLDVLEPSSEVRRAGGCPPGEPGTTGSVFFHEASTLDGFLPEASPALERLMPLGPIDGTGSVAALWWPDGEVTPVVVGLGSEGEAFVLARSVRDYLALISIGYDELSSVTLGSPPDDPAIVEATAEMRAWLREELDIEVPTFWPEVGEDEFTAWVARHRGDAG